MGSYGVALGVRPGGNGHQVDGFGAPDEPRRVATRLREPRVFRDHPIDVISGALIGVGCLLVGLLVARVVNTVAQRHREESSS